MEQAITNNVLTVRDDQLAVIKNTIARGATDSELAVFVQTCNRLRLDPFARQIFLVKRYDSESRGLVATPQVSIDGFRLVAERTGQYRGQTTPQWCGRDGIWKDVWLEDLAPAAARVGVYRAGFAEPLVRVARWESYVQTKKDGGVNSMWSKMGDLMLAKCAESLALRSAFPNELSGMYTTEEMPEPVHVEQERHKALPDNVEEPPLKNYSVATHVQALELCKRKHLEAWLKKYMSEPRTDDEADIAFKAFKLKCLTEGVDAEKLIADCT